VFSYSPQKCALTLAVLAALGCGGSVTPSQPPPTSPPPAPPAESTAPADAPTAPAPFVAPAVAPVVAPVLGPSPFHIAGEHPASLHLFPLGTVGFLLVDGRVLLVRDDHVSFDRGPNRGLPTGDAYESVSLVGVWPDTAFAVATRTDQKRRRTELFFWDGTRWKSKMQTAKSTELRDFGRWNLRRVLSLVRQVETGKPSFQVIAGFPLDPVPVPEKASPDKEGCAAAVLHERAAILVSGHVLAAGKHCDAGTGLAVELWEPGAKKGKVSALPQSEGVELSSLVALNPTTAFAAGVAPGDRPAYLAAMGGNGWSLQETPMRDGITRLAADAEGTLWAVTRGGEVWTGKNATWAQVPLPKASDQSAIAAVDVWPRAPGDTWVVGRSAKGNLQALLHTRPHEGPIPFSATE